MLLQHQASTLLRCIILCIAAKAPDRMLLQMILQFLSCVGGRGNGGTQSYVWGGTKMPRLDLSTSGRRESMQPHAYGRWHRRCVHVFLCRVKRVVSYNRHDCRAEGIAARVRSVVGVRSVRCGEVRALVQWEGACGEGSESIAATVYGFGPQATRATRQQRPVALSCTVSAISRRWYCTVVSGVNQCVCVRYDCTTLVQKKILA